MKLITRDTDYAIRAICCMAGKKKKVVSVSELVGQLKIPRPFLRKTLQILSSSGILISHKGKGGGFELADKPDKIFLVDIIKIFQGPVRLNECLFKNNPCLDMKKCPLRAKVKRIEGKVLSELRPITIASLLKKG